jgi:hypothetical protein
MDRAAQKTLEWTRDRLERDEIEWLAALPARAEPFPGVTLAHGTLDDPREGVRDEETGRAQLARLPAGPQLLLLGHTHEPWLLTEGEPASAPAPGRALRLPARALLNPGGVGQSRSRKPLVRCVLLDLERREATWFELVYDHRGIRRELRKLQLPRNAHHVRPPLRRLFSA